MKRNRAGFQRLLRWAMAHKVQYESNGLPKRCLLCNWEPAPGTEFYEHIKHHVEADEITEQMMLEEWSK